MRSHGCSLTAISLPILLAAALLSLGNFYAVSELATAAHKAADAMKNELKALNPLVLLQSKRLLRYRGAQFIALGKTSGEAINDFILALPGNKQEELNWAVGKKLEISPTEGLQGKEITIFAEFSTAKEKVLLVENAERISMPLYETGVLIQAKQNFKEEVNLSFKELYQRWSDASRSIASPQFYSMPQEERRALIRRNVSLISQFISRVSSSFALITFTLLGIASGITVGRNYSWWPLALAISCTTLYVAALFAAKGIEQSALLVFIAYFVPQLLIIALCLCRLRTISRGSG